MADQTAEALAAHPRWEWREGVRPRDESPYTRITPQVAHKLAGPVARMAIGVVPDLDDDGTAGILLGMVREWGDERGRRLEAECIGRKQWRVCSRRDVWAEWARTDGTGESMGEAAGRCLLACWALDAADGNDKHNTGHGPEGASE